MHPIINLVDLNLHYLEMAAEVASALGYIAIPFEDAESFLNSFDPEVEGCSILGLSGSFSRVAECLTRLRVLNRDAQVLLIADRWELNQVVQAMKCGAAEIVDTTFTKDRFRASIESTLAIDRSIRRMKADAIPDPILQRLTLEESRIFSAMVRGRTTKQIATELDVSVRTVHYRKKALLAKIGVKDRSEAIELVRQMRTSRQMVA
ncbi:MAG: LuxR C-terminal-related transcriptional regulator [Planctomycetota bacterium]|nr:LuxR C-terminal-related transcriptional regulator [Planctomycetota bacterium]